MFKENAPQMVAAESAEPNEWTVTQQRQLLREIRRALAGLFEAGGLDDSAFARSVAFVEEDLEEQVGQGYVSQAGLCARKGT